MTMHLQRGLSSLRTHKPTFKLTKKKRAEWEFDWMADNKLRKSQGMPKITFEQYCDNRLGKVKLDKPVFKELSVNNTHPRYVDRVQHQSLNVVAGNTLKRETMKYDGERKLLGIAVLHKSCLQPVFSQQEAEEIAKMRRG
jgi:hypothetical protein